MAFHVEFFVEDKRLADALRGLAGVAIAPGPTAKPVVNARGGRGGGLSAATNGELVNMLRDWIRANKLTTLSAADIQRFCIEIGKAKSAYAYAVKKAQEYGLLRKTGKGTKSKYVVVEAPATKPAKAKRK